MSPPSLNVSHKTIPTSLLHLTCSSNIAYYGLPFGVMTLNRVEFFNVLYNCSFFSLHKFWPPITLSYFWLKLQNYADKIFHSYLLNLENSQKGNQTLTSVVNSVPMFWKLICSNKPTFFSTTSHRAEDDTKMCCKM